MNASTTLPPPLKLPGPRGSNEYRFAYFYKVGKGYLQFYKACLKQILGNRKTAKLISAQYPALPILQGLQDAVEHRTGQLVNIPIPNDSHTRLSRAEFQLLRRHQKDIKKVPIFALLLAIFGEWLPLFVVFLDPLLPGTVLLPSQILKRRNKAEQAAMNQPPRIEISLSSTELEGPGIHERAQLVQIGRTFSLLGPISKFGSTEAVLRKIRAHQKYLNVDDQLLLQEFGTGSEIDSRSLRVSELDELELDMALEERGLWRSEQSQEQKIRLIQEWLSRAQNSSTKSDFSHY